MIKCQVCGRQFKSLAEPVQKTIWLMPTKSHDGIDGLACMGMAANCVYTWAHSDAKDYRTDNDAEDYLEGRGTRWEAEGRAF